MGLDISIVRKSEWLAYDEAYRKDEERRLKEQDTFIKIDVPYPKDIIYGRKTPYLWDYFIRKPQSKVLEDGDEAVLEITYKDYVELCMKLEKYRQYAELIWEKVCAEGKNNKEEFDEKLDEIYEETAKRIFDAWNYDLEPYWGYQEEMGVILQILEHLKEVEEIYKQNDSCVILMSY